LLPFCQGFLKPAAVHGYGAEVQREKWVRVVGTWVCKIIVSILGRKFNLVQFALEANQRRAKKEGQNTPSQANSY
jgi:hypothetical protein